MTAPKPIELEVFKSDSKRVKALVMFSESEGVVGITLTEGSEHFKPVDSSAVDRMYKFFKRECGALDEKYVPISDLGRIQDGTYAGRWLRCKTIQTAIAATLNAV